MTPINEIEEQKRKFFWEKFKIWNKKVGLSQARLKKLSVYKTENYEINDFKKYIVKLQNCQKDLDMED